MPKNRRNRIAEQLRAVRRSLAALDRTLRRLAASTQEVEQKGPGEPSLRKLTLSPARRAALKLQGQDMGYLRNLKPKQRARVKAARATKAVEVAIGVARRMRTRR